MRLTATHAGPVMHIAGTPRTKQTARKCAPSSDPRNSALSEQSGLTATPPGPVMRIAGTPRTKQTAIENSPSSGPAEALRQSKTNLFSLKHHRHMSRVPVIPGMFEAHMINFAPNLRMGIRGMSCREPFKSISLALVISQA